ncbi:MAG: hypothetical protein OXC91_07250 [Rhodobacteraceae bacterium]|nr:hypothetical protein [Paracoccaceae bacterium]
MHEKIELKVTLPICRNCIWHIPHPSNPEDLDLAKCGHETSIVELDNAKPLYHLGVDDVSVERMFCLVARAQRYGGYCGKKGRHYEAHPPSPFEIANEPLSDT